MEFLAEQKTLGNRPVALKLLSRKLLDAPGFLLGFREARQIFPDAKITIDDWVYEKDYSSLPPTRDQRHQVSAAACSTPM
jgi:hypothetical protein